MRTPMLRSPALFHQHLQDAKRVRRDVLEAMRQAPYLIPKQDELCESGTPRFCQWSSTNTGDRAFSAALLPTP